MSFKIGQKVKVAKNNTNENYDNFRNKILIITHKKREGQGYDKGMFPKYLYSFKYENGEDCPCSLYDYELEGYDDDIRIGRAIQIVFKSNIQITDIDFLKKLIELDRFIEKKYMNYEGAEE